MCVYTSTGSLTYDVAQIGIDGTVAAEGPFDDGAYEPITRIIGAQADDTGSIQI